MNIETGTVTLKTLVLVAVGVFGIAVAWQAALGVMRQNTDEIADIRRVVTSHQENMGKLTMVICLETPASLTRCQQLGLMK